MAEIVGIHGVGHQYQGESTIRERWLPPLKDGLRRADIRDFDDEELACAFYGDLFRPKGKGATRSAGLPPYDASDVDDPWEAELLLLWAEAAAEKTSATRGAAPKGRTPQAIQRALNILSRSSFFAGMAENLLIFNLKQVRRYLGEDDVRAAVQARIADAVEGDTRILIGHSLGSIVAYEALCAHPEWPVTTLITLGSPLGIANLIFDRLLPRPEDGTGVWPAGVARWTNIADGGDIVALEKQLSTKFGEGVQDRLIDNGATAHDITPYLTAEETGHAIASGL